MVQCLLSKHERLSLNTRPTKNLLSCSSVIVTKKMKQIPVPVPHPYNPRYSRGRDQEDCASKAAPAKLFITTYLKRTDQKQGWRTASGGNSTCLASMTLSVQTQFHPPKNRVPRVWFQALSIFKLTHTCAFQCNKGRQECWHMSEVKASHESPEEGWKLESRHE
jgi:hypothetical protein